MAAHWTQYIAMALLLSAATAAVQADSYRCGRKVVRTGDAAAKVLSLCGEPMARQRAAAGQAGGRGGGGRVELWFYRRSPRSLEHVFTISGGRVLSIEVVGR
jgi:hypothetical protein